jgi:hypothetical protein
MTHGRVDHCLSTAIVEQVLGEIDALGKALGSPVHRDTVMIGPHRP